MSFLVAFAAGAVVAAFALLLESWSLGHASFTRQALAAYAFLGGSATALARVGFSRLVHAEAARLSTLAAALAVVWANALYVVNVNVLASEPYFSAKSLLCDALATIPYVLLILWMARSRRLAERRQRHGKPLAALGLACLGWSIYTLSTFAYEPPPSKPTASDPALPDLVLVILDSARRDHLGFHGYGRPTSPRLDGWTSGARVYDTAFAASSWTVPTVTALLNVRLPNDSSPVSVVDQLTKRGYTAACFTDNPHLTPGSPLTAHFDITRRSVGRWRDPLRRTLIGEFVERVHGGSDEELVDRALAWAKDYQGPKFLYVHLMDSHTPYRFEPIDGNRRPGRRIEFPLSGMSMTREEREDVVARYDGGLRSASDQAARLLAGIEGLKRPFVAIVTSDHGESLGEEERWFHGTGLFPELLAVPLFVAGEGVAPGRVASTIGHSSIPVTLLSLAKVPCEGCRGSDLRTSNGDQWVHGGLPPNLRYMVGLGHKLVVDVQTKTWRLYSLVEDPLEQVDIATSRPEVARRLLEQRASTPGSGLNAEMLERIKALGYIGAVK